MSNPRGATVAVITRTKDRKLLLDRAIKSIHNQTFKDFIHVIINDGGNPEDIEELLKKHQGIIGGRVKLLNNQQSQGMETASNLGIKSVDSEFIAIHDDDDTWHKDFLKCTTQNLKDPKSMGVVVTTDRVEEEITNGKIQKVNQDRWLPDIHNINLYSQCLDNYMTPITFLYRRSVFKVIGYYDESLPVTGDWDFGIRFLQHFDINFLDHEPALAYYHHRPKIKGVDGNTVFAQRDLHERYVNLLLNKYLRQDLKEGKLGIGYIMNSLKYLDSRRKETNKQLDGFSHAIDGLNLNQETIIKYLDENRQSHYQHIDEAATKIIDAMPAYRIAHKIKRR